MYKTIYKTIKTHIEKIHFCYNGGPKLKIVIKFLIFYHIARWREANGDCLMDCLIDCLIIVL